MGWRPTVIDGMQMGDGAGGRYRVFNPPRWRLDRWIRWYVARGRVALMVGLRRLGAPVQLPPLFATGRIAITFRDANGKPVVVQLRVERVKTPRYNVVASAIRKL